MAMRPYVPVMEARFDEGGHQHPTKKRTVHFRKWYNPLSEQALHLA
jgi:hypothetical protein